MLRFQRTKPSLLLAFVQTCMPFQFNILSDLLDQDICLLLVTRVDDHHGGLNLIRFLFRVTHRTLHLSDWKAIMSDKTIKCNRSMFGYLAWWFAKKYAHRQTDRRSWNLTNVKSSFYRGSLEQIMKKHTNASIFVKQVK